MDKPAGLTSHDVVARVRRVLKTRAVGHTGTLDPFATGLLLVLVGPVTRLARFLEGQDKGYHAVARLGMATDTEDATGTVVATVEPEQWPGRAVVEAAMAGLVGEQMQVPPAYSAKRIDGTRSYQMAREGRPVSPAAVSVTVREFRCLDWTPPLLEFRTVVSAGTYVRSLARDLGAELGLGGHLTALRRETIGSWRVDDAVTLDQLVPGMPLIGPAELLRELPEVSLTADEARDVSHGRLVRRAQTAGRARLLDGNRLVAVGESTPQGWHPMVVLEGA
ncbi:MAG: tRNA pseudouridine(55) synthase TruB [Gemmatimonadota bacterium]|nr:tRNA pseudouridine(55) synthase TruB [Gemmatimonadota bacterium]